MKITNAALHLSVPLIAVLGTGCASPLLRTGFETDPYQQGWGSSTNAPGQWIDTTAASGEHCILTGDGSWQSPPVAVIPLRLYRVRFKACTERGGYAWAQFYDADGKLLPSDCCCGLDGADQWETQQFIFRAKAHAMTTRISFLPHGSALYVDDVTIEAVGRKEAARLADTVYATMPRLDCQPDPNRWSHIPRTIRRLRDGGMLKVVMLGDSIINDTANSNWDTLLEHIYPYARVEVITSVRNLGSCEGYLSDNLLKPYVLDYHPDLVIIGGISTRSPEAVRQVIRQLRAASDAEIMVLSRAAGRFEPEAVRERFERESEEYGVGLRKVADEEKVEFVDMTTPWMRYVATCGKGVEWLHRDRVHTNERGKQVLGRILLAYFSPKPTASPRQSLSSKTSR